MENNCVNDVIPGVLVLIFPVVEVFGEMSFPGIAASLSLLLHVLFLVMRQK